MSPQEEQPLQRTGRALPALALARPVTMLMLFVAMVVLGAIAYLEIPRQLLPSGFTPPFLYVHVPTRSAPPRDIEATIAAPIEESFSTVGDIFQMQTFVRSTNAGFLIQFSEDADMDVAYASIRDRLERTTPDLPEEVGRYFIWKYNPNNDPVYWVGATLPEEVDPQRARGLLEQRLVRRLERIPGVSRVELEGAPERQIRIEIDDALANAAGVGTYALVQQLQQDNFAMSAGAIRDGPSRIPLRVVARFQDLEQIRDRPVAPGVRLGDVATVGYELEGTEDIYRINGKPGVVIQIFKEGSANTVEVCAAVHDMIHSEEPELEAFSFIDFFNRGYHIEASLQNLQETALWGGVFAMLVLFVFLRQLRVTLMVTVAIPISLLVTLVVMYFTGSSLNALSLMGLMLSVGMVVDNSIVVVENIQRARQAGLPAAQAAVEGAGEVALAIVVATATTVVVFLPLILMSGSRTLSFYLGRIGYPVCIALVASLLVSLALIPVASSLRWTSSGRVARPPRMMSWLEDKMAQTLDWCLRRRSDAVLLSLAVFLSMFYPANNLKETEAGVGNPNDFRMFADFSPDMTWEERDAWLRQAEAALEGKRQELGISDALVRMREGWGRARIRVFLLPPEERDNGLDRQDIAEAARQALPQRPGVTLGSRWSEEGNDENSISLNVTGPDSARLEILGADIARRLRGVEGVTSVQPQTDDEAIQELQMTVQRDLAARQGLTPLVVGGSIDFALRGRRLRDLYEANQQTPMIVSAPEEDRQDLSDLKRLALPDPSGGPGTAVGSLTDSRVAPTYSSIKRLNRRTVYTINVSTDEEDLKVMGERIDQALEGYAFPRGYSLDKGERFARLQTNASERTFALLLAIVCVFLLMGVLFESFVLPLAIVVSIPFAFVGVYWTLFLTGTSFDVMSGVGMVILVGVVVNNAVVLVDLVSYLRQQGLSRREALVEAGRKRLRPILMTALTTIFGLVPMAVGTASLVGIPYAPLGRTLIGGLATSTLLTLFVVPLCYTLFDDLRLGVMSLLRLRQEPQDTP